MQFQIWRTLREINGEINNEEAKSCVEMTKPSVS